MCVLDVFDGFHWGWKVICFKCKNPVFVHLAFIVAVNNLLERHLSISTFLTSTVTSFIRTYLLDCFFLN